MYIKDVTLNTLHCTLLCLLALLLASPAWADCVRDPQGPCLTPDPALTPGAVDPRVTQATLQQTICAKGYTKTIRHTSGKLKAQIYRRYGGRERSPHAEVDHLIPLEVGGADVAANLWIQSYDTAPWNAHLKDRLEHLMRRKVCAGELTLAEGQAVFLGDWRAGYVKFLGAP